jgi:Holliday junction resolvase RusA-like endonuclease
MRQRENSIVFEVAGKVEPKGRGRVGMVTRGAKTFSTVFTPSHTRKYEHLVRHAAGEAMGDRQPLECAVEVFVHVYLPYPKSATKRNLTKMVAGILRPCTKPDIDNYVKSALDGINNIIIKDDNQVVDLHAHKVFHSRPHLRVEVRWRPTEEQLRSLD